MSVDPGKNFGVALYDTSGKLCAIQSGASRESNDRYKAGIAMELERMSIFGLVTEENTESLVLVVETQFQTGMADVSGFFRGAIRMILAKKLHHTLITDEPFHNTGRKVSDKMEAIRVANDIIVASGLRPINDDNLADAVIIGHNFLMKREEDRPVAKKKSPFKSRFSRR